MLKYWFKQKIIKYIDSRPPDEIIDDQYLYRWKVFRSKRLFNIYIHKIVGGDVDRHFHNHPWWSLTYLVHGAYKEFIGTDNPPIGYAYDYNKDDFLFEHSRYRSEGQFIFRSMSMLHKIFPKTEETISLFITGPKLSEWGFRVGNSIINHKDYIAQAEDDNTSN